MGKERVLIFDLCQGNIDILAGILAEFDCKISSTNDKNYFFELIKENKFDLIFMTLQTVKQMKLNFLKKSQILK